jgi:hypothetical protein
LRVCTGEHTLCLEKGKRGGAERNRRCEAAVCGESETQNKKDSPHLDAVLPAHPEAERGLKHGTHRSNRWPSATFGGTRTNLFGVFSCVGSFWNGADRVWSDSTCKV